MLVVVMNKMMQMKGCTEEDKGGFEWSGLL